MRHRHLIFWLLVSVIGLSCMTAAYPQQSKGVQGKISILDTNTVQILKLKSGIQLVGRTIEIRENEIVFQSKLGTHTIAISDILEIKEHPRSAQREGGFWFPNPNKTRLYFSPTARMLPAGKGYYQNIYLFFNGFGLGVTDNFTIGGGMSFFPTGEDFFSDNVYYVTPKIGITTAKNVHLAVGLLFIYLPFGDLFDNGNGSSAGIVYTLGTVGEPDKSFTAGLGYGFAEGELADRPFIMLGGDVRLSRRISFVTENWGIPGADGILISYGLRFFGEKLSVDLALLNVTSDFVFPGVPYVDFVVSF